MLTSVSEQFAVPRPVPLFAGSSLFEHRTGTWEALSFLPGHEVGFRERPPLHAIGAFIAAFHQVSMETTATSIPRPGGARLTHLGEIVDWDRARTTMGSAKSVELLRRLLDGLAADLERVGYAGFATCVVHGDPTTFNVLADGEPPQPAGLIDFELADVEAPIADIAFCLWRSGRPAQRAPELDAARVSEFLAGYQETRPLTQAELAAIPICLRGRGLQMLAKRTRLGIADDGPLQQLLWIEAHQQQLLDAAIQSMR